MSPLPPPAPAAAERLPGETDANRSGARIAVNGVIASMASWIVLQLFGIELDMSNPAVVAAVGAGYGVFYRASRAISKKFPILGYILFADNSDPVFAGDPD